MLSKKKKPLQKINQRGLGVCLSAILFIGQIDQLQAATIDWQGTISSDMDNASNWSPATVPGAADTGVFSSSSTSLTPTVTTGNTLDVGTFLFSDATPFNVFLTNATLEFQVNGITNQGLGPQTFNIDATSLLEFFNSSSADTASSGKVTFQNLGTLEFYNFSTASNAIINNSNALNFNDSSTAGSAVISSSGAVTFNNNSTAGSATFNTTNGSINFYNSSSAQNAAFNLSHTNLVFNSTSSGGSSAVNLTNSSTLTINENNTLGSLSSDATSSVNLQSFNLTVGSNNLSTIVYGIISGSGGSLTKVGNGTLDLQGANTYTGTTTVLQGNLLLSGSVAGNILVNGGVLSGTGTAGADVTVNSPGTIAPGNGTIGTFNVTGNYVQNPGSTYSVLINSLGQSSLINVGGTATLNGGEVAATTIDGGYLIGGSGYHILHANGGVSPAWTGATVNNPYIVPILSYTADDAYLTLRTDFINFTANENEKHVARQIDGIADPSPSQEFLINNLLGLNQAQLQNALDQLTGEQYTNLVPLTQEANRRFLRTLYDPLRPSPCPVDCCKGCNVGFNFWVDGQGARSFLKNHEHIHGYKLKAYDVTVGSHLTFDNTFLIGVAGNYEMDHIDFNLRAKGNAYRGQGAVYLAWQTPCFYVLSDVVYGYSETKIRRFIHFGDFFDKAHSKPKIHHIAYYAEAGINAFSNCNYFVQPFVGVEIGRYDLMKFREHDSQGVNLRVRRKRVEVADARAGLHIAASCGCITLSADGAWNYRLCSLGNHVRNRFAAFGKSFGVEGVDINRNSIDGSINLAWCVCTNTTFWVEGSGEKADHYSTYGVSGGVNFEW